MARTQPNTTDFRDKKMELENILNQRDINPLKDPILLCYDKDGPLDNPEVAEFEPIDNIEEVANVEDRANIRHALVSGWPIEMLQDFSERYLEDRFNYFSGSLGTTVSAGGVELEPSKPEGVDARDIYQGVFEAAADERVKILPQPNQSSSVASFKVEAEEPNRANTAFFSDEEVSIEDIASDLPEIYEDEGTFWYDKSRDEIKFDNTSEDAKILTEVLTENYNFPGVRFGRRNGSIVISRDRKDKNYGLEDVHEFTEKALSNLNDDGYQPSELSERVDIHPNDDYGADVVIGEAGKHIGAEALGDLVFGENYTIFHVGDSRSDFEVAQELDNVLFFPQESYEDGTKTQAYELSEEYLRPEEYLPVSDGAEYARLFESSI